MNKRFTIVLLLILFTWVFVPAAWCGKDTIKLDSFAEMVFESSKDSLPRTGRQRHYKPSQKGESGFRARRGATKKRSIHGSM